MIEEEEEPLKALQPSFSLYVVLHCEASHSRLGNLPFQLCSQKRHLEMTIILTLRQQSVL